MSQGGRRARWTGEETVGAFERLTDTFAADSMARRWLAAVLVSVTCALLLTDFRTLPAADFREGEVASRDVIAPFAFTFTDEVATVERQQAAMADVAPVFDADLNLAKKLETRIAQAFDMGRRRVAAARMEAQAQTHGKVPPEVMAAIGTDVMKALDFTVEAADMDVVMENGFAPAIEELTIELLGAGLRRHVIEDRSVLPSPARPITVLTFIGDDKDETSLDDFAQIRTPDEARQAISLYVLERFGSARNSEQVRAAAALARAAIRPNFAPDLRVTADRQRAAKDGVGAVTVAVRRGSRVVRTGDVGTPRQVALVAALREAGDSVSPGIRFLTWLGFVGLLIGSAAAFANATIRKFSTRTQDLEAMGFALALVLLLGRIVVSSGSFLDLPDAALVGALGLMTPVAGGAMLIRILINSESAMVWAVVASLLAAAGIDQSSALASYLLATGLVAAAGVGQARERLSVLRAGLLSGVIGAGLITLTALLRAQGPGADGGIEFGRLTGFAAAAMGAGVLNAMFALGLVPAFELFGFVTDYKLLELSNLNHPLLRQLMLRAPGTYHHSVIVGSLSEAACETIGANALLARVACYFHDIGKGLKPQYFVENQREGANRHDRLSPEQSAQLIINHVREGAILARQYNLPRPIYDNIFMHHGTGLIQYFYARAKEAAADVPVDEANFRYPGPKPNSREAGVIMLADKVEAACRTIREPTEERIRAMIQAIINSVMIDGQFEDCPLTLRELYQIADSFTAVLLGIYHHRIEYPGTKAISEGKGRFIPVPKQGAITLEIVNPLKVPAPPVKSTDDYEAVEALPGIATPPETDDS